MLHSYAKIFFVLLMYLLLGIAPVIGQSKKVNKLKVYQLANEKSDKGDYLNALELYKVLYDLDTIDKEINYRMGVCYFHIKRYKSKSLRYFEQAKGYDNDELKYYLAANYQMRGDYNKALEYFQSYQKANYEKEHSFREINDQIAKCLYAKYAETHPLSDIVIENLGDSINTPFDEYAPLIPADESVLVFTSKRSGKKDVFGEYYEDILISKRKNNYWTNASGISPNINTPGNNACTGLSADGQKIIIYNSNDTLLTGNFYTSVHNGTDWTVPQLLESEINSKDYIETSACYAPDGETVFFSSDMPGGYGGKDLYMIKKLPNGAWGKPYNLGANVNTPYDEDAPFVHPIENVLFFSSQGQSNNMGGYDVFKCSFNRDSASFAKPENIGYPINTSNDDIFFVLNTNGTTGYFSSERKDGFGLSDIYKIDFLDLQNKYTVISCQLTDENGNAISGGKITLSEDADKIISTYTSNPHTGKFILIVKPDKQYKISIYAADYIAVQENYTYKVDETLNKKFILKK
ncbi:MAG: PD40 domain-containing protein [Bacteroidetes bacterium]|nr:PD40 domain-containing protein [Bacteroidota bacterium]